MDKHGGGESAMHHIESGEENDQAQARPDASEDIHELRKFVMDMMHAEMEFVERIKQNEDSIATVNRRIEEFKRSVRTEQHRNKTIQTRLKSSMDDLRKLEDKKLVLEAKYRQFRDAVEAHGLQSRSLNIQHQELRDHVRRSEEHVDANETRIASFTNSSEALRRCCSVVVDELGRGEQITMIRSDLQKILAKRRYIDQHTEQLENDLHNTKATHKKLMGELEAARLDLSEQNAMLVAFNQECSRRRAHLLEEVHQLRVYHEQSNKKLKAKQKKYRVKMRAEIVTLKKRVAFLTTELENHEMNAEDTLSSIAPFRHQREELEARKIVLEAEVARYEEMIVCAQQEIENFDTSKEKFNICELKSNLAHKNEEVEQAVRVLKTKKDELDQLQDEERKLRTELDNLDRLVAEASTGNADEELATLINSREELQMECISVVERESIVKDRCERLNACILRQQKQQKSLKAATSKIQKELRRMSICRDRALEKLEREQGILAGIDEADQSAKSLEEELDVVRAAHVDELKNMEQELCKKEHEWKQQCLDEETRLKTELQEWNAKVEALQAQLRAP